MASASHARHTTNRLVSTLAKERTTLRQGMREPLLHLRFSALGKASSVVVANAGVGLFSCHKC
jgi:hypothetical protein